MVNNIVKTFRPAYKIDHNPSRVVCVLCFLISCFFYLTAAINTATAATYYLDAVNGDDSNPGTSGAPWKTSTKALSFATSGDIVMMHSGNYGDLSDNTARTDWLTFRAVEGETPIFQTIHLGTNTNGYDIYLRFDGINVKVMNSGTRPYSIYVNHVNYVEFLNCYIYNYNRYENYRVRLYGDNLKFHHCEIFHDVPVDLEDYASQPQGTRGLELFGDNLEITNNYIHDFTSSGIYVPGPSSGNIENNHIAYRHGYWPGMGDYLHGSLISLHSGNLTIRRNIIHGGARLLNIYGSLGSWDGKADDLVIENNLFFDGSTGSIIRGTNDGRIGDRCKFNHNTVICKWNDDPPQENFARYAHAFTIPFDNNYSDDFEFYNNIIIGDIINVVTGPQWTISTAFDINGRVRNDHYTYDCIQAHTSASSNEPKFGSEWEDYWILAPGRVWNAGGNIVFAYKWPHSGQKNYSGNTLADSTILTTYSSWNWKGEGWDPELDFFLDGSDLHLDTGCNLRWIDFRLKPGSPAINYGEVEKAIPAGRSLGSIGPDGFIRDDGVLRDENHHSAGCYESSPIDPNNPPPVLQAIGDKPVDENVTLIFDVNATDPNSEPITYSAQNLPSGATLDPQTGEFAWTPSYQQAGSYQVTFRASDGNWWDSETITITVNNVNRPPVIGAISDQSVNENALLSLSVNASDPDGQALTYSVSGLPAGAVFASQTLTWTPSYDQAGTYPVTFTADDGQAQDSQAITITVINVNRTPVLAAINNQSVWADDPLTFTIDATDPDGDAVTYSAGTLPSGATFTGQDFDWTPSQGQMGSYAVTFIASDGQLQDSQMVTITVDVDSLAPTVTNSLPTAGSIQAPLNNLINLNITDAGKGIDTDSVTIKVNNNTVYTGDTNHYSSPDGECRRLGNKTDYRFVYQSNEEFDYDQTVGITVTATDLAGNVMSGHSYSFVTEMRSFGQNKQVNSGSVNLNNDRPVTVRDSSGNIWTAWHAGPIDNRDIYISKLAAEEEYFGDIINLTEESTADQCNPVIAVGSDDKLYVVWQDNREGDWDIYVSTSVDGISWSTETRVNDPNNENQVNPAIVIDGQSPNHAHVVWQDDRAGNQDICIATSSDGFTTTTVSQITTDSFDQVEPAVAADFDNTIYVVWTDTRNNGKKDIYGAASNNGPWTNVPVVTEDDGQSSPAIATEAVGAILHLVWVDDRLGDDDIYYDKTIGGLSPLTGSSIIDDTTGADQISPVIITTGYTGNDLEVFACWRDERNADADLYFVEIRSGNETNVFVGDDGTSTDQSEPAIGIDGDGYPYLLWTNERIDICYAGSTFVEPVALASTNVSISSTATVGTVWNAVNSIDDVSAEVPQGAYLCDVKITISKIKNPPKSNLELELFSGTYEFGPSGMEFIEPVTITIPYEVNGSENVSYTAYWYNPLTDTLSQQGITDVETIVISSTLHAVCFKTTHFSAFILGGGVAAALGGGGGGCSVSAGSEGNMVEFALPYIGLCIVMAILKVRDARERKARGT